MLRDDIKILRQIEDAKWNTDGTVTSVIRVVFMVGAHGPFTEQLAKAGYTAQGRDDVLETFAREVRTTA